jgi:hypothetical protein
VINLVSMVNLRSTCCISHVGDCLALLSNVEKTNYFKSCRATSYLFPPCGPMPLLNEAGMRGSRSGCRPTVLCSNRSCLQSQLVVLSQDNTVS